jgi:hypothetical protein
MTSAPIVSDDPQSKESKLASEAKRIQAQSDNDSNFDTVLERYTTYSEPVSIPLLGTGVALFLLAASVWITKKRKF